MAERGIVKDYLRSPASLQDDPLKKHLTGKQKTESTSQKAVGREKNLVRIYDEKTGIKILF
jgi:hypothetical protein